MTELPALNEETHEMYSALINYEDTIREIERLQATQKKYNFGVMWMTARIKNIIYRYSVLDRCDYWVRMRLVRPKFIAMYLMAEG